MSSSTKMLKCPNCLLSNIRKIEGQRAVCHVCSQNQRRVFQFCWACQREWPKTQSLEATCTLPHCALIATLLTAETIEDTESSAYGCPFFRACPKCKALLTHTGEGCTLIVCPQCATEFCFRCLREECGGFDNEYYYESDSYESYDGEDACEYETGGGYRVEYACSIVDNSETLGALQ